VKKLRINNVVSMLHCHWKVIVAATLVAVTAGAVFYYWQKAKKPASLGKTVTIARGTIRSLVQASGSVAAVHSVDITSRLTGRIVEVLVAENDVVRAGQVLVVLDGSHYQALVEETRSRLTVARQKFDRAKKLASAGVIAAKELDQADMALLVAESEFTNAVAQLEDTVIRSPIDGTVIGKPVPAGQTVSSGLSSPMVLMTIADVSKLELQVLVDESDIGAIRAAQKVGFTVDAVVNKMFVGKVAMISEKATVQQNVVYYPVTISVESLPDFFKPGMTVRITVVTAQKKDVVTVPAIAINSRQGNFYVNVLDNGQIREMPIIKGLVGPDRVEVASGLQEGDQVLLPPGAKGGGMMGLPSVGTGGGHHN